MRTKRDIINWESECDERRYLISTSVQPEQVERLRALMIKKEYDYRSFHCGCVNDCCGCFCGFSAAPVVIFGNVFIAVTERYNY